MLQTHRDRIDMLILPGFIFSFRRKILKSSAIIAVGFWLFYCCPAFAQEQFLTPENQLQAGVEAYNAGELERAITLISKSLEVLMARNPRPENLDRVLYLIILAQLRTEDWSGLAKTCSEYLEKFPQAVLREEAAFYKGMGHLKAEENDPALAAFQSFLNEFQESSLRGSVLLLLSQTLVAEGRHEENAKTILPQIATLTGAEKSAAFTSLLASLIASGNLDQAVDQVLAHDASEPGQIHMSGYFLTTLQLGDLLISKGELRKALRVLQKIPPSQEIIQSVDELITAGEQKLENSQSAPAGNNDSIMLRSQVEQAKSEVAQLREMEDFDAALQLRKANCFFDLSRFPEAVMVYERMLELLPDQRLLEQAHYRLILALIRMESWPESILQIGAFEKRFPASEYLPDALYLQGEAHMQLKQGQAASDAFLKVPEKFPKAGNAERSHFLAAYALLLIDKNQEAIAILDRHIEKYASGEYYEEAHYWRAMGLFYAKEYPLAREAHGDYLERFPQGAQRVDSQLRMAQCLFNQGEFKDAQTELSAFLEEHPDSMQADEARNLLGDALLAVGGVDAGLQSYSSVSRMQPELYDYAQMRISKVYNALEEWEKFETHLRAFMEERPESGRVPEALKELATHLRAQGKADEALDLYWSAVTRYGNDPEAAAVEEMLVSLTRIYRTEDRLEDFFRKLEEIRSDGEPALAARARWVRAKAEESASPDVAKKQMAQIAESAAPQDLPVVVLADVADALLGAGELDKAHEYYRGILRWYPRSFLKGRAHSGMAFISIEREQWEDALGSIGLAQKESVDPILQKDLYAAESKVYLATGRPREAVAVLEEMLALPVIKGLNKVETLYQIANTYVELGDFKKAIAFYQQIYILHLGWPDYVAKSYWQSGQAFEQLEMPNEARNSYEELINNADLVSTPEYVLARQRLEQMKPAIETSGGADA